VVLIVGAGKLPAAVDALRSAWDRCVRRGTSTPSYRLPVARPPTPVA